MKKLFLLLALLLSPCISFSFPSGYEQIQQAITSPDKLISTEFSNDIDGKICFVVTLISKNKINSLSKTFSQIGLEITKAAWSKSKDEWVISLKALKEPQINSVLFEQVAQADWAYINNDLKVAITPLKIDVTCTYQTPESLSKNLNLAADLNLKFSSSIPHPNSSSAIFSRKLIETEEFATIKEQNPEYQSLIAKLENLGQVYCKPNKFGANLNISVEFSQIPNVFATIKANDLYPTFVDLKCNLDGMTQMKISVNSNSSKNQNKIEKLLQLLNPKALFWVAQNQNYHTKALVNGFSTTFNNKIKIFGITAKSSKVFSELFPMIKRLRFISAPFFSRGTYKDINGDRIMNFEINCEWN